MEMSEIIDKVSELYRDGLDEWSTLYREQCQITKKILEADYTCGESITLAEYNYLKEREKYLKRETEIKAAYNKGMSAVRELLMDLGFDTEVT